MISWIQRYFQHHFRVIFAVLLGVIIISFVFTIGAAPGIGRGDRQVIERQFFGYNLNMQADQQRLMGDAGLSANLRVGAFGNLDSEQIQNYAFQRAATLHLADKWHIPAATQPEIEGQIKTLRMFFGQDGQFDAKAYQTFRDNLKTNPRGLTEADIVRIVGDDVRAEKVQTLLSGPGYVLPAEVKNQILRADTSWTLATASADYAAFKPEIKPTDVELTQFFEQSGGRYDIPPRVVVSAVEFPALAHVGSVTVTDADVRAFYDSNPSRFPKPDAAKLAPATPLVTPPADPAADFAAVRPQVEAALRIERAQALAVKAASDFALALYDSKAATPEAIEAFVAGRKLAAKTLAPFTRDSGPAELGGSPEAATQAFRLSKDRLVSEVVPTPAGAAILVWKETQASHKPLFTQVREKVSADYVENERRKRFVELGKTVKTQIETRLKAGDAFEKAAADAAAAAGLKLEAKTMAAFTLRSRPQDADYSVLGTLERLEKGQVSDMVINVDKGIFVYAAEKKAPDLSETNPQFAETRKQIAAYNGRFGASAYISELVESELKKSEPKVQ
ncbi:peptidylprolyl isomerase [Horticoccus sp. 23ND18S-11]|uniref:peptidylprolyl isomerase n=1 Tax=Horticoccus sp. 23ND18S-11 TaxID=3391832 RepID=UPI0039C9167D